MTEKVQVSKEKYHGGHYEGSEIRKMLKNISVLEDLSDEEYKDFIPAFHSIKSVNEYVAGRHLEEGFQTVIDTSL